MSGEYYGSDDHPKFYTDYEASSPHSNKDKYDQDHCLNDIEEQLEFAENRCNVLKDQLGYMRECYGCNKVGGSATSRNRKISNIHNLSDENLSLSSFGSTKRKNQNIENSVETDNTGSAVKTINNILNGITNSVNRLSELHVQISESPRSRIASINSPNRYYNDALCVSQTPLSDHRRPATSMLHVTNSNSKSIVGRGRNTKRRTKESKIVKKQGSAQAIKKNVKVDKKIRVPKNTEEPFQTFSSAPSRHGNLIELFHNKEIKSSDSDVGQTKHNHGINCDGDHLIDKPIDIPEVPLLQLSDLHDIDDLRVHSKRTQNLDEGYEPPQAPRIVKWKKSYQTSTIASRMKQVAKSYLNSFSFKTMVKTILEGTQAIETFPKIRTKKNIPFCSAISTSPSHNIGINIQQVINIMKTRQPVLKISPTIAHNIGLPTERNDRTLCKPNSALITVVNSRTSKSYHSYMKPQACPLFKCNVNYQQMQELAKSIPEETQEDVEEEDTPGIQTVIMTGPTGDVEVKTKNVPTWVGDATKSSACTCVQQYGMDLNHIANRIKRPSHGKLITSQISLPQRQTPLSASKWNHNPKVSSKPKQQYIRIKESKEVHKPMTEAEALKKLRLNKTASEFPLNGKEKNLKEVLTNLHDEFEKLNTRYEELSSTPLPSSEEVFKEMAYLEDELNKKEEEITMVMSLCKEVMALKHQIKSLKKTSSQSIITPEPKDVQTSTPFNDYNNPQAAFHLTKLLKQIQTYQMRYKNGVGI